jgi:hypothetical protein
MSGIYQPNTFFTLVAKDEKSIDAVRVIEKLIYKFIPEMNFYTQHYWAVLDSKIYPAGWMKWGWLYKDDVKKKISYNDDGEIVVKEKRKKISQPLCEAKSIYDIYFDYEAQNQDDMRFVAERYSIKIEDIENNTRKFNMTDEVKKFLDSVYSEEPKKYRVDVYEYWTKDEVTIITDSGYVICHQPNPYNKIPYRAIVNYPVPRQILGVSPVESVADILDAQDDLLNASFDNILQNVYRTYVTNANLEDEDVVKRPGAIIKLKPGQSIVPLAEQPLGMDWLNMHNSLSLNQNKLLGNIDLVDVPASQTATQARFQQARLNTARRAYIDYNRENYLKWALEFFVELIVDNMTIEDMKKVLSAEDIKKLNVVLDDLKFEDINYTISITADNDIDDRMIYISNIADFLNILTQIYNLKQAISDIDFDILLKTIVNKYNLPDGILKQKQELPAQATQPAQPAQAAQPQLSIDEELNAIAQSKGVSADEIVNQLAQMAGVTPEQIIQEIQNAGSVKNYLEQKANEAKNQMTGGAQ